MSEPGSIVCRVSHSGNLFGEFSETISLIPLITGVTFGGTIILDPEATMETLLTMAILTRLVQSTARCLYSWQLLHLATGPNLKIFFLGSLFLSSILAFLFSTSFLSGGGRVLDLRGCVGGGGLDARVI